MKSTKRALRPSSFRLAVVMKRFGVAVCLLLLALTPIAWSGSGSGTVDVPLLPPPTLSSPSNFDTNVSTRPLFDWFSVSGANRYWVMVATSASALPTDPGAASCPGCVIDGYTSLTSYTPSFDLDYSTTYHWQVQAFNNTTSPLTQGEYSSQWSFTTEGEALLPPPALSSPSNFDTNVSTKPPFDWSSVSGANGYWLMVATSSSTLPSDPTAISCPGCVISELLTSSSYTPSSNLDYSTTYHWQVQAFEYEGSITNVTRQGEYSSQWSFTTGIVSFSIGSFSVIVDSSWDRSSNWTGTTSVSVSNTGTIAMSVEGFSRSLPTDFRGDVEVASQLPLQIVPGTTQSLSLNVTVYPDCPNGTYTIAFSVSGTP